jgi:peptide/nickel transport system substrate-binding protein
VVGKLFLKLLMTAMVVGLLCSPAAKAAKDELVIGITQFPSSFHPTIDTMMAKTYILSMTRRPFTAYDKDWLLVCMLCTKLPTIENGLAIPQKTPKGAQGIAVTYTIQPNATWGDGMPVTTKDVLFSWRVGRHPKSGISSMEFYRSLYKIDALDDKTFTLHFDKITFDYNAINDFSLLPAHIDELNFTEPEDYKNKTAFDQDTENKGLYFGPYVIQKVASGSHVLLKENPTWWGEKPKFKRIIVRVISNTAALEANLLSGAIDMISGEMGLTVDQALAFEKRHSHRFNMVYQPGLFYEHIDFNLDNPILADIRVRQALILALDRKTMTSQLFGGRQPVAHTSISPLDWVYAKDAPQYSYNPAKAAKLLSAAGWKPTVQGVRINDQGEKLSLEIMTTAGNRSRELVEQVLQSYWKALGIEVRIRNQPARVFFGETVTQRKFTAMAMFAWISAPESVPRTTLHSAYIPRKDNNYAGQNYTGFKNKEVDQLIDSIEVQLDKNKRAQMWSRLQHIYAEEIPVIPLYFRANPYVLPKWLSGVEPTGHQYPSSLWIENWKRKE